MTARPPQSAHQRIQVSRCVLRRWILAGCLLLAAVARASELIPYDSSQDVSGWVDETRSDSPAIEIDDGTGEVGEPEFAPAMVAFGGNYSDDIVHIVNAVGTDPLRLFDFVRNNIRFVPYFGFRQGPDLTLLTRQGNDGDQAELLVALLRAAGHTSARFEYGEIIADTPVAKAWFRVDGDNALLAVTQSDGHFSGFPSTLPGKFLVNSIWVKVTVGGVDYRMHPAFRPHTASAGIAPGSAMDYDRAALLAAAGGTAGSAHIQGVSDPAVAAYAGNRSATLLTVIRGNYSATDLQDLLGAYRWDGDQTQSLAAAFPAIYALQRLRESTQPWSEYQENSEVYVGYPSGGSFVSVAGFSLPSREVAGRRIGVVFNATNTAAQVWLDDTKLIEESANVTAQPLSLFLRVARPYFPTQGNVTFRTNQRTVAGVSRLGTYVPRLSPVGYGDGPYMARRKALADSYRRQGLGEADRGRRTESLHLLSAEYGQDVQRQTAILGATVRAEPLLQYSLGVVSDREAMALDMVLGMAMVPRAYSSAAASAAFRTAIAMGSLLEQTGIEKAYPSTDAVSTIHYARANNASGGKTFYATSANYNGTVATDPDFQAGWSAAFRNVLFPQDIFSGGLTLIIPQDGEQTDDQLLGNGYFGWNGTRVGAFINALGYSLKGGYPTTTEHADDSKDPKPKQPTDGPAKQKNPESEEPVDLLTGAYIFDRTDLDLGSSAPRGLSLSRHYSSVARDVETTLGGGWRHGYDIRIQPHADSAAAFGSGSPEQAAQAIVACHILNDLFNGEHTNAKGWVVASIIAGWLGDNLRDNAATLVSGRKNLSFIRLPDGTYASPPGIASTLSKNASTGLFSLDERQGRLWTFDSQNRAGAFTDADGKSIAFAYHSGNGLLSTIADAYGRNLTFVHHATGNFAGLLANVTDSTGRSVAYTYHPDRLLHTVTDPVGGVTRFEYNAEGRLSEFYNELDQILAENGYDSQGRVISQTFEGDPAQTVQFAIGGFISTETTPVGLVTTHHFDAKGRRVAITEGTGNTTRMEYDGQDRLVARTDARNQTTTFEYDARHNLTAIVNPNLHRTEFGYDAHDRLDYITAPGNFTTDFHYDAEHHLFKIIDPRSRETTFEYYTTGPHDGLLWKRTENDATVTEIAYDSFGFPQTTTRRDGSVVTAGFDAVGNLRNSTITAAGDPNTHFTNATYDNRRRLRSRTDALGFSPSWAYDARDILTAVTDRFGDTAAFGYTPLGRPTTTTVPSGSTVVSTLDTDGRDQTITNSLNQATGIEYDGANRVIGVTDPLGLQIRTGFDPVGNRRTLTNARNQTWTWTHTPTNLTENLTTPLNRVFGYTYDNRDLLDVATEPSGQTADFDWWADGRLKRITDSLGHIDFEYDALGRLHTVTEGNTTLTRTYDDLDRLESFSDSNGNTIGYRYDGAGNLCKIIYPDLKEVIYGYDSAGRLDIITDWGNRTVDFQYDANSRLHVLELPNNTRRVYSYDFAGRLAGVRQEQTSTGNLIVEHSYQYDPLDRIQKETVTPEPAPFTVPVALMTYDNDDRLDTWQGQQCVSDLDGNLVTGPLHGNLTTFTFDARNRLTAVGNATFTYDLEGRRSAKTEGNATTTYVHDPQSALSRLLAATTGNATTRYVHTPGGMLLYEDGPTGLRVPHPDYRGSTVALSNATGSVIGRVAYGIYGEVVSRTGDTDTRFLYHGAYGVATDDNGLCLMRARYYSTETRRFLNADPLGFGGGVNWYGFVTSQPSMRVDPHGLESYVVYDTKGFKAHGHVGLISKNPKTGVYTRFDHAWGTVTEESSADVKQLIEGKQGSDVVIVIPDYNGSDQRIDEARAAYVPHPGGSTYENNCITSVQDILEAAGVRQHKPLIRTPNRSLDQYLADPDYVRRAVSPRGKAYIDDFHKKEILLINESTGPHVNPIP